jgi:glycosyltransferase involved in cell wall biosynthesis
MSMDAVGGVATDNFFGYGVAFENIYHTLNCLEINNEPLNVKLKDSTAKVQLHLGGNRGSFFDHQYKIQMAQWESTQAPEQWGINSKHYDEFWTANYFGAEALKNAGVDPDMIHVYEHGVDSSVWTTKLRGEGDKIRFLHIDSGNQRKRSDVVEQAFKKAFGNNPKYELTLKYSYKDVYSNAVYKRTRANWSDGYVLANNGQWEKNVRRIYEITTEEDLVSIYHYHDVLVYPSEGEGFGFIPLQAIITGMPTISTGHWPSYEKYLNGNIIDSTFGASTIKDRNHFFPGQVVLPDVDSTIELMIDVAKNIEKQSKLFFKRSAEAAEEYSWANKTIPVISSLVDRVGIEMFH